jgi:hypothetical protein
MSEEMERWQAQAALTARAVVEAKHEVLERRREMEVTKDKMDRLVGGRWALACQGGGCVVAEWLGGGWVLPGGCAACMPALCCSTHTHKADCTGGLHPTAPPCPGRATRVPQLDKLYVGREQQLMLSTAINTAHYHQQTAHKYMGTGHARHHYQAAHQKLPAITAGLPRCASLAAELLGSAGCARKGR